VAEAAYLAHGAGWTARW